MNEKTKQKVEAFKGEASQFRTNANDQSMVQRFAKRATQEAGLVAKRVADLEDNKENAADISLVKGSVIAAARLLSYAEDLLLSSLSVQKYPPHEGRSALHRRAREAKRKALTYLLKKFDPGQLR